MSKKQVGFLHIITLATLFILALTSNGVGGGGDSLTHYFISQLSWQQPSYFFFHWGKPFFTLFSSPWAQFGFIGIKLFNILCGVLASYITYLLALKLNKKWAWLIPLIAFITPAYYTYLFSGLTEPFSALLAVTAVYLCLNKKASWGFILASFLPFCRNEAQIFLPLFVVYGLLNKEWKKLPFLLTGYILYSLIGGIYLDNFTWVFESPYDSQGSVYGSGNWDHYISKIEGMSGVFSLVALVLGTMFGIWKWVKGKMLWRIEPWLVQGIFFALVVVHSTVWVLGIYGSAGLERTLILVFPFMWLIILDGILLLREVSSKISSRYVWLIPLLFGVAHTSNVISKPLTKHYYKTNIELGSENEFIKNVVGAEIKKDHPTVHHFVIDKPYMAVALNINFMDNSQRSNWSIYNHLQDLPKGALLLYDSYYVPVQYGIPLERIESEGKLSELKRWDDPNSDWHYILYKVK